MAEPADCRGVDTNVLLVANQQHAEVSTECVARCIERLQAIQNDGVVVIDDNFIILGEYQNKTRINPPRAPGIVVVLLRASRPRSRRGGSVGRACWACCWCGGFVAGGPPALPGGVSVGAGHARDCGFAASKAFASTALVIAQLQINSIPKRIIANTINEFCSQRVGDNIACGCLYLFFTTNGTIVVTAAPDIFLIASFTHGSRRRRLHCANQ